MSRFWGVRMRLKGFVGLGAIALVGCTGVKVPQLSGRQPLAPDVLAAQVQSSVVRISYGDQAGQGTGFFIAGEPDVCTVATAAHVVKPSELISISAHDSDEIGRPYQARAVQVFPNQLDLAIVTFAAGESCPYQPLTLGDSEAVKLLERVYLFGYPDRGEKALYQQHSIPGEVSALDLGDVEGYNISYATTSAVGMSGGPLVNAWGEVIGIHGREEAGFRFAIPIGLFEAKLPEVLATLPETVIGSAKAFYEQGLELFNKSDYERALLALKKSIEISPDYVEALYQTGLTLFETRKYEEAVQFYNEALEVNRENSQIWNSKGLALLEMEEYSEALDAYNTSIEINPEDAEPWFKQAEILKNFGYHEQAIQSYESVLEIDSLDFDAWNKRGLVLGYIDEDQAALDSYENSINISPENFRAWFGKGSTLVRLNRHKDAISSFKKAFQLSPNYASYLKELSEELTHGLILLHTLTTELEDESEIYLYDQNSVPRNIGADIDKLETIYEKQRGIFEMIFKTVAFIEKNQGAIDSGTLDSGTTNLKNEIPAYRRFLRDVEVELFVLESRYTSLREALKVNQ